VTTALLSRGGLLDRSEGRQTDPLQTESDLDGWKLVFISNREHFPDGTPTRKWLGWMEVLDERGEPSS
jgi:hypothetical protein